MRPEKLIIIGGSAGSLSMVLRLLPVFRKGDKHCVILVFHRKESEMSLADLLNQRTELTVKEAEDKEMLQYDSVFIAPGDYHLLIEKNGMLSLDDSEKVNHSRPSIDVTFESAAEAYGERLICILLSGANADGAQGLLAVKEAGGKVIIQSPASAEVAFMPQQALNIVQPDLLLDENNMNSIFSL